MKLPRRRFLHLAVGAAALPAVLGVTKAQTYPSRQVRRRRTDTRCCWSMREMPLTRRSTTSSTSISFAISRRSLAFSACLR
jgi:hypothetical protein